MGPTRSLTGHSNHPSRVESIRDLQEHPFVSGLTVCPFALYAYLVGHDEMAVFTSGFGNIGNLWPLDESFFCVWGGIVAYFA